MLFPEDQDPAVQQYGQPTALPTPPAPPPPAPLPEETLGAAFRTTSLGAIGHWLQKATPDATPVAGYSAAPSVVGTKYEDHLKDFLGDVNPGQTNARKAEIDYWENQRDIMARSGIQGTVAALGASLAEPWWWFIPGGIEARAGAGIVSRADAAARLAGEIPAARTAAQGVESLSPASRAFLTGGAWAAATVPQQAVLQSIDPTHTWRESAHAVAANAILAGILGGGQAFLSSGELRRAAMALDASRRDYAAEMPTPHGTDVAPPAEELLAAGERLPAQKGAEPSTEEPTPAPLGAANLSAAAAERRTMELEPWNAFGLRNLISTFGPEAQKFYDNLTLKHGWISPVARMLASDRSDPGKLATGDLVNIDLHLAQEKQGIPPSRYGLSAQILSDGIQDHYTALNSGILTSQFAKYRGKPLGVSSRIKAAYEDRTGAAPDKMPYDQFKTEVAKALLEGGQHQIPEVAETARMLDQHLFQPMADWLHGVKDSSGRPILGDITTPPKGDLGLLPRFYSVKAIMADPKRFESIVSAWLAQEQAEKAATQTRLGGLNDTIQWNSDRIKYLNAKIEGRETALEGVQNRAEEIRQLNQFAYNRSAKLSQPIDDLREKLRGIQAAVKPHLDTLEQLAKDIKAERKDLPDVRAADAALWKLIGANQRLKEAGDIVGTIEGAQEYVERVDEVVSGFRAGIKEAREQASQARQDPSAATLSALEKSRAAVRKEISPYVKELNKTRRGIAELEEQRVPGARGGAVFETQIRNRGNALADRASGKQDEIDRLHDELGKRERDLADARKAAEEEIKNWHGDSSEDAKAALKAREKYEAERASKIAAGEFKGTPSRLTSADEAIDKAIQTILDKPTDLSPDELDSRASEIRHRIVQDPDGRLPYDDASPDPHGGMAATSNDFRGSLNRRAFAIPTKQLIDFIHTDLEHVIPAYLRNVVPDALLIDRFGDIRMTETQKKVNEWYDNKIRNASPEQAAKLTQQNKEELADLVGMRDRFRGVYGLPTNDWERNLGRISKVMMKWNIVTMLNSSVLNRFQDITNAVARRGMMGYMKNGFVPYMNALMNLKPEDVARLGNMKRFQIGVDTQLHHIASNFGDIVNDHMPGNKFERSVDALARGAMLVNLHGWWTDGWRRASALAADAEILDTAERMAEGTHSTRDVQMMAYYGLSPEMMDKIWSNLNSAAGHTEINGVKIPNTASWEPGVEQAYMNALRKESNIAVAMPGQEKPFWISTTLGSAIGQFRSFEFAAWHKIMISNLQMGDAKALQGMLSMFGMGMLSCWAYSVASGRDISAMAPQDWVKEGILRSGMLGPFSTMNTLQAKLTNGKTDLFRAIGAGKPPTRRDQTNVVEDALGPSFKELLGAGMAIPHAFSSQITAKDVNNARQTFIPLQNYMFFRQLLDQAEDNFDQHFGIKPMNRNPTQYPKMWGVSE